MSLRRPGKGSPCGFRREWSTLGLSFAFAVTFVGFANRPQLAADNSVVGDRFLVNGPRDREREGRWFSADPHLHGHGCGAERGPRDVFAELGRAGLDLGSALVWGDGYEDDAPHFSGRDDPLSTADRILHYDLEVSTFTPDAMGHLVTLGVRDLDFPRRLYRLPAARWAKGQGGVVGFAHCDRFLDSRDFVRLRTSAPAEAPITVALGYVDFLGSEGGPNSAYRLLWSTLENSGFRLAVVGESDWPCLTSPGGVRTYFWSESGLTYSAWLSALREGRTSMGVGDGNFLSLTADGVGLGDELQLAGPGEVTLEVHSRLAEPGRIRIMLNGNSILAEDAPAGASAFRAAVPIDRSSWIAVWTEAAMTSAIYITLPGQAVRPSERDPRFLVDYLDWLAGQVDTDLLIRQRSRPPFLGVPPEVDLGYERERVLTRIGEARAVFEQRAAEARAVSAEIAP